MYKIYAHDSYSKIEQLFDDMNDEAFERINYLESLGYKVDIIKLPSYITTPQEYSIILLDQLRESYDNLIKN